MSGIRQFEAFAARRAVNGHSDAEAALREIEAFDRIKPRNRPARRATSRPVTSGTIEEIKRLDASGLSQHAIAERLHVNQGRVNEVLKGRR
jgi:DNA-binding transcriptional regulator YiaG